MGGTYEGSALQRSIVAIASSILSLTPGRHCTAVSISLYRYLHGYVMAVMRESAYTDDGVPTEPDGSPAPLPRSYFVD